MELIKNKRGIFFTITVIIMLSLFLLSFTFSNEVQKRKIVEKRVSTMNNFLESTESDFSRKMYIFGYREIFINEKRIVETGNYVSDLDQVVNESFFNKTINSQPQTLLEGVAYQDIINDLDQEANKVNVNFTINSPRIKVEQNDPWKVSFTFIANIQMNDLGNTASWNKNISISSNISITNFDDPIYYIQTGGLFTNNITQTPFSVFVSGSNANNLSVHALNSYYKESTNAPSFINRLEGNFSASPFGVESMVNLQKLSQQGVSVSDKSVVDYIYFSNQDPRPICTQPGMPSWFKIDQVSAPNYNITC